MSFAIFGACRQKTIFCAFAFFLFGQIGVEPNMCFNKNVCFQQNFSLLIIQNRRTVCPDSTLFSL